MKERPILMSGPNILPILEGRKTQTRRIVKSTKVHDCLNSVGSWDGPEDEDKWLIAQCPHGKPGDRLWVRETFSYSALTIDQYKEVPIWYWADGNPEYGDWEKPKPSIFMPRWASRILLEITEVRVERLQDISEGDARAEGLIRQGEGWRGATELPWYASPVGSYKSLWESINGAGSWDANPWVWVIEFKRIDK